MAATSCTSAGNDSEPLPRAIGEPALLERLAQRLEHVAAELRQLVEEQHAAVGERELAGTDRAVRRRAARRPTPCSAARAPAARVTSGAAAEQPGDAVDGGDLDRLGDRERRQDRRQAARQHGLARSRRRRCSSRLCAPAAATSSARLACCLPAHVRQVARGRRRAGEQGHRVDGGRHAGLVAAQVGDGVRQRLDADDRRAARERCLARVRGRDDEPRALRALRRHGDRQDATHAVHATVETELAQDTPGGEIGEASLAVRGEDAERDGQVVVRPFLADAGGRQVDGDAALRVLEAGVAQRRADPVGGLAHGAVGEADGRRVREPGGDVDLDVDDERIDAAQGAGADACEHVPRTCPARGAGTIASCGIAPDASHRRG